MRINLDREQLDAALGSQRLITLMSRLFAGLALALSALGLYGLIASSVAQRKLKSGYGWHWEQIARQYCA